MSNLLGILETVLYVDAFERACPFTVQVLGLNSIYRDQRLCGYDVGGRGVLLLFLRGHSLEPVHLSGGTIPPHDGHGPARSRLRPQTAPIGKCGSRTPISRSRAAPPSRAAVKASISAIPDGYLVELATPGLWPGY
jgi:hypothetical protein